MEVKLSLKDPLDLHMPGGLVMLALRVFKACLILPREQNREVKRMIKKSIKSTIVVLLLLGIFTGLAAAVDDIDLEEDDDLPNTRAEIPSQTFVDFPYGASDIYHANIDDDEDDDWFKSACVSGDHFDILIDLDAYHGQVAYFAEDENYDDVLYYGDGFEGGNGDISYPPLYVMFTNIGSVPYTDYMFFAIRST